MRNVRLWRGLLGVDKRTVIEDIEFDEEGADGAQLVVARVRPRSGVSRRCGRCGRKAPWYDRGEGRRRWRGLDWGTVQVVLEADAPRVNCPAHGPTVVAVPWARHHAGHTLAFDDTVAWLAVACSKTAVCELMRIAWRTVGAIVARVWADTEKSIDRFANLRRIGIDEISYKRHHKYLTVVVDHDSGRLVWAAPGRDTATLRRFFDALGAERCAQITHVSADAADWIADVVGRALPGRDPLCGSVLCRRADYADVGWVAAGQGANDAGEVGIIRVRSRWFLHYQRGTRACTYIAFTIPMGFGLPARWRRCPAS